MTAVLGPGRAPRVFTVTELAQRLRATLDAQFGTCWVAGEISNLKRAASGHIYFTLKDDECQIASVMFRSAAQTLPFDPRDGMDVVVAARPGLYPARGNLQLYVDTMEPRGLGALRLAFEQLKERLAGEGLFSAERKKPLPPFPRAVGIVTALAGAAIHDMRTVLRRRWPAARVVVRPVRVQGREAAGEIARAIGELVRAGSVDVIIVGRGGGSLEDLWAFNEEVVARAIVASPVPVVSAVGHEVDFTIADFVADARAPTPTAAAALVVPDRAEVEAGLVRAERILRTALARRVTTTRERLTDLGRRLGDPRRRVEDIALRIDDLGARARAALVRRVGWDRRELGTLASRIEQAGPAAQVRRAADKVGHLRERLERAISARQEAARVGLAHAAGKLDVLSPLACLERGYAIVRRDDQSGPVVRDAATLVAGDRVALTFARGHARAVIDGTEG